MMQIIRTDSNDKDFLSLIPFLDKELRDNDGDEADFYEQQNQVDHIKHVIVAYLAGKPAGCGAIKHHHDKVIEVKRMFVPEQNRRKGISKTILQELEKWAHELGYDEMILETGKTQTAAIELYLKYGFYLIPNYPPYIGVNNSVCMQKTISI